MSTSDFTALSGGIQAVLPDAAELWREVCSWASNVGCGLFCSVNCSPKGFLCVGFPAAPVFALYPKLARAGLVVAAGKEAGPEVLPYKLLESNCAAMADNPVCLLSTAVLGVAGRVQLLLLLTDSDGWLAPHSTGFLMVAGFESNVSSKVPIGLMGELARSVADEICLIPAVASVPALGF